MKKRNKGLSIKEKARRLKQSKGLVHYKGGFKFTRLKGCNSYLLEDAK